MYTARLYLLAGERVYMPKQMIKRELAEANDTVCSFMDHNCNIYDSLAYHVSQTREAVLLEELSWARQKRVCQEKNSV